MVFARRLPQLEVEIEAVRLQVIVDGLYQVFPDPDRYFMAFPQYFLFTLPVPTSVTSPLHLQPWDPRSSGRRDTIPPTSGIFVAGAYFVEERGIWDRVKWIDGIIYIHTSLGPEHLGEWAALMYYLQKS